MTGPYEDEVELAPGIYLTKRKQPSTPSAPSPSSPAPQPARPPSLSSTLLSSSPADTAAHLQEEISRLRRSVELLLRSNQELKEADPNGEDHVFVEAITENTAVIARQLVQIRRYEEELATLSQPSTRGSSRGCGSQAARLGVGVAMAAGAGSTVSAPTSPTSSQTTSSSLLSPPSVASPPLSSQSNNAAGAEEMDVDADEAEGVYL
ncbi:hypothetical protein HK097_001056 [Rhizophlyctis rosea]|uniref:Uncharacterized protein n=1 Tax=Rhizophlyctis rosea TaxID=64517 RepID=A0AAD5SJG9_9FUNG|nr:hypothetical protein HK097_001056 [Rhizophlyctis rosea]